MTQERELLARGTRFAAESGSAVGGLLLAGLFRTAAVVRRDRPLHPRGSTHAAVVEVWGTARSGVPWLDRSSTTNVELRFSRATGVPSPLPDVHGIAVRVPAEALAGAGDADLLFASTGDSRLGRFALAVRRHAQAGPLTTLLPVRSARGPLLLRLTTSRPGPAGSDVPERMVLAYAVGAGPWEDVGEVVVGPPLVAAVDRRRHDPVLNQLPGTSQYPVVARLREPSYREARRVPPQVGGEAAVEVGRATQWHRIDGARLRCFRFTVSGGPEPRGTALIFPGLGLPRYTFPLARLLASQGIETMVFDALAWPGRGRRLAPAVPQLSNAGALWMAALDLTGPVVAVGHSTGSQVALEAVLSAQDSHPALALVMAGPTFQPAHRSLGAVAKAALTAYRKDSPRELVVLKDLARVRTDVVGIVRSGLWHRPEDRVGALRVPLTITAGEADSFASAAWLDTLAARAGSTSRAVVLPGSHNNVFTHRREFAALVAEALEAAGSSDQAE